MIEFRVKMDAPSAPNLREHHMVRARRVKAQRGAVQRKMPKWEGGPLLVVRLTRVAPRALDGDNLQGAMKAIRDQVATGLRVDDCSPLVEWEYRQAKGEAEVVVQIWRWNAEGDAPPLPVERAEERNLATSKMKGGRSRVAQKRLAGGASVDAAYYPPRSKPVDAARDAEATFAPVPRELVHFRGMSGFCTCGAGPEERCG